MAIGSLASRARTPARPATWFGWETPEYIARINDQGETSLHNMSSWLDHNSPLIKWLFPALTPR